MYLFFDRNGTLKEQITVSPIRVGDSNVDKVYVYWDSEIEPSGINYRYKKPNDEYTLSLTSDTTIETTIPYDQDRDLKFFKYGQTYKFYVCDIPDDIYEVLPGMQTYTCLFSCWFIYGDKIKTMGLVAFGVEPSTQSVAIDQNINIAQWNELIKIYNNLKPVEIDSGVSSVSGSFDFTINVNDYKGLYVFSYFNNVVFIPIYNEIANNDYILVSGIVQSERHGEEPVTRILQVTRKNNVLSISSYDENYGFVDDIDGVLQRIVIY